MMITSKLHYIYKSLSDCLEKITLLGPHTPLPSIQTWFFNVIILFRSDYASQKLIIVDQLVFFELKKFSQMTNHIRLVRLMKFFHCQSLNYQESTDQDDS